MQVELNHISPAKFHTKSFRDTGSHSFINYVYVYIHTTLLSMYVFTNTS